MGIRKKHSIGFSLLEVLVAFVILAIGILGVGKMLLIAHKSNSSNFARQQAVQSAYDIMDRIRSNRQAGISGNYNGGNLVNAGAPAHPASPSTNCDVSSCSSSALAAYDTWQWLTTNVSQLPNGCGSVNTAVNGTNTVVTVIVQWDDSAAVGLIGGVASGINQFTFQSAL